MYVKTKKRGCEVGSSAIYITKKEIFAPGHLCWEDNLYWDVSGKKLKNFADLARWETDHKQLTFSQWQKQTAYDQHALYADPGFVDLEKRDLHLKEDSILRKKSFPDPAITLDQAGVRKKK